MRQKNYWSYFALRQIRLVEGKIAPAVLLPREAKQTQPFGIAKISEGSVYWVSEEKTLLEIFCH